MTKMTEMTKRKDTTKRTLHRPHVTYVRDDIDISKSRRLYHGKIVRVPEKELQRAYELLHTITDQHLSIGITHGVSHRFHYRGGVNAYVYGPDSAKEIQHIKIVYGAVLPLLEMLRAVNLPSPRSK
ncbi:hypothetical protein J4233_03005 [Candidatus Pacearchaeota archaeon]|nr:hypothetical protein [Candidatus Pacearchaeota archaeon]